MKFTTINPATGVRKQRQSLRSCETCQRRKRRCTHTLSSELNIDDISDFSNASLSSPLSPNQSESGYGTEMNSNSTIQETSEANSRASKPQTGDLNLESVIRSATSSRPATQSIGTYLVENLKASGTPRRANSDTIEPEGIFFNTSSTTQKLLSSLLEEECFSELPSEEYLSRLLTFYAEEIYPIFPIINIKSFETDIDRNSKILLSQAMCLLASTNPQCKGILYLRGRENLLTPRLFGRRLFCAMRCVVEVGAVTNKMVQIQALGALSLFNEGLEGPETASQSCAKMIQLVHTLGLHVQMEHEQEEEHAVTALCCAWAVDRLNAAIHGRPVSMHERDIGRDINKCIDAQSSAFRLLLRVISQLDKVIDLYRPQQNSKPIDTEFSCPRFEDIIISTQCTNLQERFLNTIEVMYLAVAILSCRNTETLSNNRTRQISAASRISSLVRQEYGNQLLFLSFIPHAVSLSLSISYKQMRYTKVPLYRQRARSEVESTTDLLEQLSAHYYISSVLTRIGRAILAEMDRVQGKNILDPQQPTPYSATIQINAPNTPKSATISGILNPEFSAPKTKPKISDDADVFELFDTNFGLQGIDAVFQSGLDLCLPIYPPIYTDRIFRTT